MFIFKINTLTATSAISSLPDITSKQIQKLEFNSFKQIEVPMKLQRKENKDSRTHKEFLNYTSD